MRALMWFRSDLRIDDNRALHHACDEAADGVVAAFLFAADQWRKHDWGPTKADFIRRCVAALRHKLADLNIPLLIRRAPRFDDAPDTLLKIARDHHCDRLYYNIEYEVNEQRRDEAVTRAFEDAGRSVRTLHDQTVIRPDDIQTGAGRFYTVFTPFKNAWLDAVRHNDRRDPLPVPKPQPALGIVADELPDVAPGYDAPAVDPALWPAGEVEALQRLRRFCTQRIDAYHNHRDAPALDATSTLSPDLAAGAISPRRCLAEAIDANNGGIGSGRKGPVTWISELVWREFYRHILVGFPRICMHQPFRMDTAALQWADNDDHFDAWCAGRTGVPIVDAAMRQLAATGWMHNRCRMIVAMFLTKNLFLDWRRGERFFMQHLVDGDLANNNGGWQWSASTGTDAAPYFRIFNPLSQSETHDPQGDYIRRYVQELADVDALEIHNPSPLTRSACDYPDAIVNLKSTRAAAIEKFKALRSD